MHSQARMHCAVIPNRREKEEEDVSKNVYEFMSLSHSQLALVLLSFTRFFLQLNAVPFIRRPPLSRSPPFGARTESIVSLCKQNNHNKGTQTEMDQMDYENNKLRSRERETVRNMGINPVILSLLQQKIPHSPRPPLHPDPQSPDPLILSRGCNNDPAAGFPVEGMSHTKRAQRLYRSSGK